jgi:hypothetical protein
MKKTTIAALGLALILFGCAKPPDTELEAARSAIEAAKSAGAGKSAPGLLLESTQSLDSALQEIETQKKGFFNRDFANARRLLQKAGDKAREAGAAAARASEAEALAKAAAAKDSVRADSAVLAARMGTPVTIPLRDSAESSINLAYAEYKQARRRTGGSAKDALEAAMRTLKDARTALKAQDYRKAIALAAAAKGKLDSLPK